MGKIDLHKLVDFKVMKEEKKEEKPKEIKIVVEKVRCGCTALLLSQLDILAAQLADWLVAR